MENSKLEQRRAFIINIAYFAIVAAITLVVLKYVIDWLMPFVIGYFVAYLLRPIINWLHKKIKLSKKPLSILVVIIFYGTVGVLIGLIFVKLFVSIKDVFASLPALYTANIEPVIYKFFDSIVGWASRLDPTIQQGMNDIISNLSQSIGSIVTALSSGVVGLISSMLSSVPLFFVKLAFSIISSFFFAMDFAEITAFIKRQIPESYKNTITEVKSYVFNTLIKFGKAYGIIVSITFVELMIGLTILKIPNAISIAAVIAVVDIIPVLGTGGIVIPWVIIELLSGNIYTGIGLLIMYGVILVVRNIIEPKVVGGQIGLPPVVMLMCMFVGVQIFGVLGLFLLPIIIIILKNLNDNGKIKIFK